MKTVLGFTLVLLLFGTNNLLAQQGFYYGVRSGGTVSAPSIMLADGAQETGDEMGGYSFGPLVGYGFGNIFSLQTELAWRQDIDLDDTGIPVSGNQSNSTLVLTQWTSFFNVPLFAVVRFPSSTNAKLRLLGGVSFGFELGCRNIASAKTTSQEGDITYDRISSEACPKDDRLATKKVNTSTLVGIGFGMRATNRTRLYADLVYTGGLTNLYTPNSESEVSEVKSNLFRTHLRGIRSGRPVKHKRASSGT